LKRRAVSRRLVSWVGLAATAFLSAAAANVTRTAVAQDSWVFTNAIPCTSAPVYGLPFNQCWISNTRAFRNGNVQSWKLTYSDAKSDVAIGLYKLVEAHGPGGLGPVAGSGVIAWLQSAAALTNLTSGGTNWVLGAGGYVTYQQAQRRCVGFVRNGPAVGGQINWILGAAFCRETNSPIATSEAQFIADAVRVRE
jgi:hypothetical protein